MRCLLDTHALIWWWLGDPSLSIGASDAMRLDNNRIFVSPVSAIEIGIKVRQGRLPVLREPLAGIDDEMQRAGFEALPISIHHARHAALLAGEHRDPFDRLIAAQALLEGMTVITRDREIAQFGCETLW